MTMLMERPEIEAPASVIAVIPEHRRFDLVLSRVARGALPHGRRIEIGFDESTGGYRLGDSGTI